MSLDESIEKQGHRALGVKQTPLLRPQTSGVGQAPALPPPAATAVIVNSTLALRLEALATSVETKFKTDETKAKHLFEVYWPALAALLVGFILGHFTHIL